MRAARTVALSAALLLSACGGSGSKAQQAAPRFTGRVGTAWETLAPIPGELRQNGCPGFSDYSPPGKHHIYELDSAALGAFDPAVGHTALASAPASVGCWAGSAWVGGSLYVLRNDLVLAYSIAANEWTTPVTSGTGDTHGTMTTHDDAGDVYALEAVAPYRVIRYTPGQSATTALATGGFDLHASEPRLAWDPGTRRLYVAPDFNAPELWSFDPAHPGTAIRLASVPNAAGGIGTSMGDVFCGDRSGHLYAAGDDGSGSNTVFQYDVATNAWRRLPDLPEDHGGNGGCTVTDDGWLYVSPGDTPNLFRLPLY